MSCLDFLNYLAILSILALWIAVSIKVRKDLKQTEKPKINRASIYPYGIKTDYEDKLSLPQMFEFIAWKDRQRLMFDYLTNNWYLFEVSAWVLIGDNLQLWNKFKERK